MNLHFTTRGVPVFEVIYRSCVLIHHYFWGNPNESTDSLNPRLTLPGTQWSTFADGGVLGLAQGGLQVTESQEISQL